MYILNETRSPYDSTDVCSAASLPKKHTHLAGADRSPSDAYSQPASRSSRILYSCSRNACVDCCAGPVPLLVYQFILFNSRRRRLSFLYKAPRLVRTNSKWIRIRAGGRQAATTRPSNDNHDFRRRPTRSATFVLDRISNENKQTKTANSRSTPRRRRSIHMLNFIHRNYSDFYCTSWTQLITAFDIRVGAEIRNTL